MYVWVIISPLRVYIDTENHDDMSSVVEDKIWQSSNLDLWWYHMMFYALYIEKSVPTITVQSASSRCTKT